MGHKLYINLTISPVSSTMQGNILKERIIFQHELFSQRAFPAKSSLGKHCTPDRNAKVTLSTSWWVADQSKSCCVGLSNPWHH